MRHLRRKGVVAAVSPLGSIAASVLVLTLLAPSRVGGADGACQSNVTPLLVASQRLFRHDGLLVADVVVANVAPGVIQNVHVSVELYDFFGELLRAERTVLTPALLHPTHRATFRVATPFTQQARTVAYRFTGLWDSGTFQSLVVCDASL